MSRLSDAEYLRFPFRVSAGGAAVSPRRDHVREQIEQVLYTMPTERWYRPDFGAGIPALVFEPNNQALWELTRKRLQASLSEALRGEVNPRTLEVGVEEAESVDGKLVITIAYTLSTINVTERQTFLVGGSGG
jgi:hypothetical protein